MNSNGVSIGGRVPIYVNGPFRMHVAKFQNSKFVSEMEAAQRLNSVGISQKSVHKVGDQKLKNRLAQKLTRTMTHGRTRAERIAAARALGGYRPDKYQLRAAEWGVWVDTDGKLELVQTVLDEIPPIAYQTTKQIAHLKSRINQIMIVTKPIIHFKVDRPMSIDVTAFLRKGQPWFYFPRPNDFAIRLQQTPRDQEVTDSDFLDVKKLSDSSKTKWAPFNEQAHTGYPFLLPKSPTIGSYNGRFGATNRISSIGIRWQHLIVSPEKVPWMAEHHLEPKYNWWTELRQVESAWVSNGLESEKFSTTTDRRYWKAH